MIIEKTLLDALNAELLIKVEKADYAERFEKALKSYRKHAQLPGFRPGQVPTSLIRKRFGKSILAEEINQVLSESIHKYLSENKIEVLGSPLPKMDEETAGNWEEPDEFKFCYELGLVPDIELVLDKSKTFVRHNIKVDDTLIDRQVNDIARRFGAMSEPELSGDDDLLKANIRQVNEQGEPVEGGIVTNGTTLYIGRMSDAETKSKFTGLKKGDVVTVDPMRLHPNHEELSHMLGISHEALHHLSDKVSVEVVSVHHITPHELNQELFDKYFAPGEITSVEQMRERIKADLLKSFDEDADWLFKRDMALQLTRELNPALPDTFLKRYIQLTNSKPVTGEMIDYEYPAYAATLRWELIQNQFIRKFGLHVSLDEALAHVKVLISRRFASYGIPVGEEELEPMAKKHLADKEQARQVYDYLYEEKMMEVVKANCQVTEKWLSYDEFMDKIQH